MTYISEVVIPWLQPFDIQMGFTHTKTRNNVKQCFNDIFLTFHQPVYIIVKPIPDDQLHTRTQHPPEWKSHTTPCFWVASEVACSLPPFNGALWQAMHSLQYMSVHSAVKPSIPGYECCHLHNYPNLLAELQEHMYTETRKQTFIVFFIDLNKHNYGSIDD